MSTQLIKADTSSIALNEVMTLGDVFKQSGYFQDVRDQAQAVVKILCGRELGFSPVVSMMGIHVIEGKPSLSANLMATLIKRSGKYDYRVKTWTNDECVLTFREKIDGKWEDVGPASFSIEDAKRAQVRFQGARGPSGWTKFPKAMLFARALSQGLRAYCPDVSAAPIYNPEELGADINEEGNVIDVPSTPKPASEPKKPISFKRESAVGNKPQDGETRMQPESPSDAAVVEPATGASVPASEPVAGVPKVEVVGSDCIDEHMATNFHREFRLALPKKYQKDAEELAHGYLRQKKIFDVLGKPSALAIKQDSFYDVREDAVQYAKTYSI